jgi:hypothetical protein
MKTAICLLHITLVSLLPQVAGAQLCNNPTDTIYGLNSITATGLAGQIAGTNVNTAGITAIGSPAPAGNNSNGLGFSQLNGRFYFFNQCGSGTTEFVSYNPNTGSKIPLAAPPATILTTHKIRSGTCTNGGNGYYTINPNAAVPYLYYYNIALNTWTTITSTFLSKTGVTVTDFKTLNSGDMTFDGNGNLWILCSGTSVGSKYSLFRIKAPIPTTVVASIVVDTIISIRATPGGINFTGVAFTSGGKLLLSTGSGAAAGNNNLYEMATPGVMTLKGTVPDGYGDDMASCTYPVGVLAVDWIYFNAERDQNKTELEWKVVEEGTTSHFNVEYSNDGQKWRTAGTIADNNSGGSTGVYRYTYSSLEEDNMYFRIAEVSYSGSVSYSLTRKTNRVQNQGISVFHDHAKDLVHINTKAGSEKYFAKIYDLSGRTLAVYTIAAGQQTISISGLQKGFLILKIESDSNKFLKSYKLIKE